MEDPAFEIDEGTASEVLEAVAEYLAENEELHRIVFNRMMQGHYRQAGRKRTGIKQAQAPEVLKRLDGYFGQSPSMHRDEFSVFIEQAEDHFSA